MLYQSLVNFFQGLKSHPQHELVKKQCAGFSGMVSCALKGDLETAKALLKALKVGITLNYLSHTGVYLVLYCVLCPFLLEKTYTY